MHFIPRFIFLFVLSCYLVSKCYSQELPAVKFEFGDRYFSENVTPTTQKSEVLSSTSFNSTHYQWVQFASIPSDQERSEMAASGIHFLEYIPQNCYLLAIPADIDLSFLYNKGIRSIQPMDVVTKVDPRIIDNDIPAYAFDGKSISLKIMIMPGVNRMDIQHDLAQQGTYQVELPNHERFIFINAERSVALNIADLPWIRYIELMDPKGEPESVEGRSMQRANLIDNHLTGTGALSYNGDGIKVLVRDDGDVGPHIDFQGRLWNDPNNGLTGTHGDGVAGVWAACGNLDPTVVTGGSAADVYVIDYLSTFLDNTLSLHQDSGVLITNSSYSNGCNAGYTTTTVTVDEMAFDNPTLLHMFSAGNSNNNDCGYGAGDQWGNITGGHKQGKNVIAVANLNREGDLVSSSSRGPAHDGRIKPDLAGHGAGQRSTDPNNAYQSFGGTSAAAPSTAGNLTQLFHVYQDLNGSTAPAALMKACAMNSTQDLGNVGPDFKYGWGLMHAGRAYETVSNNQFLTSSISTSGSKTHSITVPAGVGQLRIMLYWPDPEASPSANPALVNDLDLTVDDPSSTTHLPHVLDHTPNAINLDQPASTANAPDRLNNVEQVVVNSPASGTYTVNVDGFSIPQGPQEYYVVYSFIPTGVQVTYPLGGEKIVQGVVERIHWDAFGNSGTFNVEYSTNNGGSWITIASGVAAGIRSIDWTPPSVISANCLVRVSRGAQSDQSDETFNIHGVPTGLSVAPFAIDSATVSWNAVTGATSYNVYRLGITKMELVETTTSTTTNVGGLSSGQQYWFSVSANTLPTEGQRAFAIPYDHDVNSVCSGCLYQTGLPYEENFETGSGDHCNFTGDDFDWLINSGATPSSSTGPSRAYTGNQYIYVEASNPNFPSLTTVLGGPCLDMSSCTDAFFLFNYHMFGSDMGSLELQVSTNNGSSWSAPVWSMSGNQGDQWFQAAIDLTPYCGGTFTYRFVATTGLNFRSDMALDNILISEGQICNSPSDLMAIDVNNFDARITWVASNPATSYDLELVDVGNGGTFTGLPTFTGISDTTYLLTGLADSNAYEVYVRSNCVSQMSTWAAVADFVTSCSMYPGNTLTYAIDILSLPYADTNNTIHQCITNEYSGQGSPDLHYKVTTSGSADSLRIRTCNGISNFDTYLYLLDDAGNELTFNDDANAGNCTYLLGGGNRFSVLHVAVSPNTTYYIVVDGWSSNSFGDFALQVEEYPDCISTQTIHGTPLSGTYSAANTITSDAVIQNMRNVIFSAGGAVDLIGEFEVELGGEFEANNDGCP